MHKFNYYLALLAGVTFVVLSTPSVLALEQPEYGGRSSDYHPPTRNPQGSTPIGLQPTNPNTVQPAPTNNLNPQALSQQDGLKVLTSPDKGSSSTASETSSSSPQRGTLQAWIISGFLIFIALVYIVVKPDKKPANNDTPPETPAAAPTEVVKKPKKPTKKKSGKKRKSSRR